MARPRQVKNQRTIDDVLIEDADLAEALAQVTENEPAARTYRDARQRVKTIIQDEHGDLINAQLENGRPRYGVVDGHRFTYQTALRPAGKKIPPPGTSTKLEIFRTVPD